MKQKIKKKLSSQPSSLIDQCNFYINFFCIWFLLFAFSWKFSNFSLLRREPLIRPKFFQSFKIFVNVQKWPSNFPIIANQPPYSYPIYAIQKNRFQVHQNVAFRINITKKYESHSQIWSINYFSSFLKNLELKSNQIEASGFDPEHQVNRRSVLHHQFFAVVNDGCSKPCQKRKLYAEARVSS